MTKEKKRLAANDTLNRRDVLKSAAAVSVVSAPLAAMLASPALAQQAAAGVETVMLTTEAGREVFGALALPPSVEVAGGAEAPTAPAVLLVHEWWGLNDQIKTVARALADEGYIVLAADLYGGTVAEDAAAARFAVRNVDPSQATDTLSGWANWLRGHEAASGKVGTCGWCFGGGWSLGVSLAVPVDATVIYYGNVEHKAQTLAALKGPVLGHFGTRDMHINKIMVDGFTSEMDVAKRAYEIHWYEADHAFANPTTVRYDEKDASLAWERTLAFFKTHLA